MPPPTVNPPPTASQVYIGPQPYPQRDTINWDSFRPWWKYWSLIEKDRKGAYDPALDIRDRIKDACADFQTWPKPRHLCKGSEGLTCLWDQLRIYLGLSYRPIRRDLALPTRESDDTEDESDDESEEVEPAASTPNVRARDRGFQRRNWRYRVYAGIGAVYDKQADRLAERGMTYQQQWLLHLEQQENAMSKFILDPENAMKYLFSGYFWHYGLRYSWKVRANLPILALFFLGHLHRSNVFDDPDDVSKLEAAISVVERALAEYKQIQAASRHLPGHLSLGCSSLFSTLTKDISVQDILDVLPANEVPWLQETEEERQERQQAWDMTGSIPHPELARTHTRGVTECSVRRIISVHFPTPQTHAPFKSTAKEVEAALFSSYCTVRLAPVPEAEDWSQFEPSTFSGDRDTRGETITLLIDHAAATEQLNGGQARHGAPGAGAVLSRCRGMFLIAKWVELKPVDGSLGRFWFMDSYIGMAPSFFTSEQVAL